jgi:PAS domain S-box-containing protein
MATVLVVDDVANNREVVRTLLGYRGHRVLEAAEAVEALAMARREHPDVVVTDVLMPGMDGYQLVRALRSDPETAAAALVFYTGNYASDELQSIGRACGVDRIVAKTGDPRLLLEAVDEAAASGAPTGVAGVDAHVDLQYVHAVNAKLLEKVRQLGESEQRFRAIAESAPVGVFLLDAGGAATFVNERLGRIVGQDEPSLSGMGWLACFSPDMRDEVVDAVRGPVGRDVERRYRVRLVPADASARWLDVKLRVMLDEERTCAGHVGIVDDVTVAVEAEERLHAEARRSELDVRLRGTERLDSLRRLAGGVAHDYNNMLAVILSFGAFVQEALEEQLTAGHFDADSLRRSLEDVARIIEAGQRATGLSRKLQLFGSKAVLRPVEVDINGLLDDQAETLVELVGDDVDLDVRLQPELRPALADGGQVLEILQALISNARDAMPAGGLLSIETDLRAVCDRSRSAGDLPDGDYVRLTVRDTGCGMPEEVRQRAIEPFFTTKPRGAGPGLGLAAAYGTATQLGGDLRIESEVGVGTAVHVLLPAALPDSADPPVDADVPRRAGNVVLVVDDEAQLRELVARILRRTGYEVLVAADGQEALALAHEHAGRIGGLLTDVVMPRMLGSELANRLTADLPVLPVLFMSGYADPMLAEQPLGPDVRILSKPFTEIELLAEVRALVGEPG